MKKRIAALALALAFVAAPALGALAGAGCQPCGESMPDSAPCTSLSAASCCGDVAPAAPVSSTLELPTAYALATPIALLPLPIRVPDAASRAVASTATLRLSVVRLL